MNIDFLLKSWYNLESLVHLEVNNEGVERKMERDKARLAEIWRRVYGPYVLHPTFHWGSLVFCNLPYRELFS